MILARRLANRICDLLQLSLPAPSREWALAVRAKTDAIESDIQALAFAARTYQSLGIAGLGCRLLRAGVRLGGDAGPAHDLPRLGRRFNITRWPRAFGIASAIIATIIGIAVIAATHGPVSYMAGNMFALVAGLAMLALIGRKPARADQGLDRFLVVLSLLLWGAAAFGEGSSGATRWLRLGGLAIQPSLLLIPTIVVGFSRARTPLGAIAMVMAAGALASQPDRAMAGALCAGLAAQWISRPDGPAAIAFAGGIAGLAFTLAAPEAGAPTRFVDGVLASALDAHFLLGLSVLCGMALLLAPGLLGTSRYVSRVAQSTFSMVWSAVFVASALGPHPTPILGFGGSAIVGYLLSLVMLPSSLPELADRSIGAPGNSPAPPQPTLRLNPT